MIYLSTTGKQDKPVEFRFVQMGVKRIVSLMVQQFQVMVGMLSLGRLLTTLLTTISMNLVTCLFMIDKRDKHSVFLNSLKMPNSRMRPEVLAQALFHLMGVMPLFTGGPILESVNTLMVFSFMI